MVASTFSRGMPGFFMSAATRARMPGSAAANSIMCSYFAASRTSRQRGW